MNSQMFKYIAERFPKKKKSISNRKTIKDYTHNKIRTI